MGVGAYWAYTMIEEQAKLEVEREGLLASNAAVVEDNNFLLNEIRVRDKFLLEREAFINKLSGDTERIRGELADAKDKLSAEEVACLESDIPTPYNDRMRKRSRQSRERDNPSVPLSGTLSAVLIP